MKGKNLIVLGVGATGGFIGGSIFVLSKVIKSERMMEALKDIVTDRITDVFFEDNRWVKHSVSRMSVIRYRDGYTIETPKPLNLKGENHA